MTAGPGSRASDSDEIDLGRLIQKVWAGKVTIAAAGVVGLALAMVNVANTTPTFQADALLQLEERSGALALPSSMSALMDDAPRSATEIEVLRSRLVLGRAVADLNLDWSVGGQTVPVFGTLLARYNIPFVTDLLPTRFVRPGDRLELGQLSVPPAWINQGLDLTVGEAGTFTVTAPDDSVWTGRTGELLSDEGSGFSLSVTEIDAAPGRRFILMQRDETGAITDLRNRMTVTERGRGSGILEVRLTGPNPNQNIRSLNAIVQSYLLQNIARSAAEAQSSLDFIRGQLPQAEGNLRAAEDALNAFRQAEVTIDLSLETQAVLGQVTRIEGELTELQRREDELAQRFTPAHPTYRQLLDERARLEERLGELRSQVGTLPETQQQILNLTRDVELAQGIYTELLIRSQEVEVLRASTIGNVRVIDDAAAGRRAIAPRRAVIAMLGLMMGLGLGVAIVLARSWLRRGVQDPAEIERLGLSLLGTVNYNRQADNEARREDNMPLLAISQPTDLTIEGLRSLRTSLHFGMLEAETPTLGITSSHPGAGKSFLAANFAVVTAQAGQRVCLIDADLRRGQLRRYFNVSRRQPGLAEVLAGDIAPEAAIVAGPVDGLSFLSTGRYPPNPSELLVRPELDRLIAWCAERYDLTIFDTAPVLAVTDPVALGRKLGGTILVVRHDMTPLGEVEAAIKLFGTAGLRFNGAVLNGFDPRKVRGGYSYGYSYRYEYKQRKE